MILYATALMVIEATKLTLSKKKSSAGKPAEVELSDMASMRRLKVAGGDTGYGSTVVEEEYFNPYIRRRAHPSLT